MCRTQSRKEDMGSCVDDLPGREGWPEEDPAGPSRTGGQGRGPSMPVSKAITKGGEDLRRNEFVTVIKTAQFTWGKQG